MMAIRTVVVSIIGVLFVFQQTGIGVANSLGIERRPLGYEDSQTVDGCANFPLPFGSWSQRVGDVLTIRCNASKEMWSITCRQTDWIGDAGPCTSSGRAVEWEQDATTSAIRQVPTLIATLIGRFRHPSYNYGITKVEDKIYVVNQWPHRIRVVDGQNGFRLIEEISLSRIYSPYDLVYSKKSACVFISDIEDSWRRGGSIWKMTTTGDHRLTKWLTNVTYMYRFSISLSSEGHLLVLKNSITSGQDSLEIYAMNATLIRIIHLPKEFRMSDRIVQIFTGDFVILHHLNNTRGSFISRLTNDGELINRFNPGNYSEELEDPFIWYTDLSLDSENNRLYVAAPFSELFQVLVIDLIDLTSINILGLDEMKSVARLPSKLLYDERKKQLFLEQYFRNVSVFEIA